MKKWGEPVALTVILLLYSNLLGWWAAKRGMRDSDGPFRFSNPLLLLILLLILSRYRKESPLAILKCIGLGKENAVSSSLIGLAAGSILSLPPQLFFANPVVVDKPIEYGPVSRLSPRELLRLVFFDMVIGVGICEESFFRGLLEDSWGRVLPQRATTLVSATTFAGWHFAVTLDTLGHTNVLNNAKLPRFLTPFAPAIAIVGGMATTGVAGALFSLLKQRTHSLWGAVVAHWLVDSVMLVVLWRRGRVTRDA